MANREHLKILKQGVEAWNQWRKEHPEIRPNLRGADLSNAIVSATIFAGVDLLSVKGLIEIEHQGPSYVTLHTVQLPQDSSALHFLRGAGVSDEWINFYRAQIIDRFSITLVSSVTLARILFLQIACMPISRTAIGIRLPDRNIFGYHAFWRGFHLVIIHFWIRRVAEQPLVDERDKPSFLELHVLEKVAHLLPVDVRLLGVG